MLKDFMEFLSGTKMTVISAFFLLASLCFMLTGTKAFPDPVWGTIFISGTPIIYKALQSPERFRTPIGAYAGNRAQTYGNR